MFLFYPAMFGITMAITFPGFTINSIQLFGEEENLKMENLKIPNWSFDNKLIYLMLAGMGGKLMRISFYLNQQNALPYSSNPIQYSTCQPHHNREYFKLILY